MRRLPLRVELETAVNTFRDVLRQSWTRRALRNLTSMHPASLLPKFALTDVTTMRDPEWEAKEKSYHETAVDELNALVRKYNGLAPYAVRRAYYMRTTELERVYKEAAEDILQGLEDRAKESIGALPRRLGHGEEGGVGGGGHGRRCRAPKRPRGIHETPDTSDSLPLFELQSCQPIASRALIEQA